MPIYQGKWDIPALEWCSIQEALDWIVLREAPVSKEFSSLALSDRGDGHYVDCDWDGAKGELWLHLSFGDISLRGRPFIGKGEIVNPDRRPDSSVAENWGDVSAVPSEKIREAGVSRFVPDDGIISWISDDPFATSLGWAFFDPKVNFAQLISHFPPPEGCSVRIGGEVTRVEDPPKLPSAPSTPSTPSPLSLSDAVGLRARLDALRDDLSGWGDVYDDIPAASKWLLRQLEVGSLRARGKLSTQREYWANEWWNSSWASHSYEWTDIAPSYWEERGVEWNNSTLRTRDGEFIEVRIEEADLRTLDAGQILAPPTPRASQAAPPESSPYLTANHQNYSHKLAAAIYAWEAVTATPGLVRNKSVKQAIEGWLTENASRFGLIKADGDLNRQAIEDVAKVANWEQKGGVPKTSF